MAFDDTFINLQHVKEIVDNMNRNLDGINDIDLPMVYINN